MDSFKQDHASVEQLLDIRDGLTTQACEHVQACSVCQHELRALSDIGETVGHTLLGQATAQAGEFEHVWQRVEDSLDNEEQISAATVSSAAEIHFSAKPSNAFQWNSLSTAVYTLALAVVLTGLVGVFNNQQRDQIAQQAAQQTQMLQASIEELMLNSRGLEAVLLQVADRSSRLDSTERRIADRLYWRLSYLDQKISENAGNNRPDSEQVKALWGDRINALTELNQLYSNDQQIGFGIPEI